ncbi:MAG TPA: ATP phosphoribosyltransferase regulatory subunit [Pseudomonadales bacterium]
MANAKQWLLPEGVEELYPAESAKVEGLRRQLLDLYSSWGYELVFPPLIEYLDSLQTGMGGDLKLQTFTITDQLTGKLIGVRPDITPQIARIDAHGLKRAGPVRLCYAGTVLHAKPIGLGESRSLIQVGVELYGHSGIESDAEVVQLMLRTLGTAGCQNFHLDLGHVGIYRGLVAAAALTEELEASLFDIYQRKAKAELVDFIAAYVDDQKIKTMLLNLVDLAGDEQVLDQARNTLADAPAATLSALDELEKIHQLLQNRFPDVPVYFDCSELRGYHYHTGVVFAAYLPGQGQAVAKGGRYDHIGEKFGRARPATGFSADIKSLITYYNNETSEIIFAPGDNDLELAEKVLELRGQGQRVVQALPGQIESAAEMGCSKQLVCRNGAWEIAGV